MPDAISRHFTADDFRPPLSVEDKISLFEDQVRGWQLDIAESALSIPHADFGVLAILLSYFEKIAKFEEGYDKARASKEHFRLGFRRVVEGAGGGEGMTDDLIDQFYADVRSGLYHSGAKLRLDRSPSVGGVKWEFDSRGGALITVDPSWLVWAAQRHFSAFMLRLRRSDDSDPLRRNFETRFDYEAK